MDKIIVFDTFYNPIEANIVKARLLDSDIQCFLSDENTVTINPLYTQALGGVKLHLFEKDAEAARTLLEMEQEIPQQHTAEEPQHTGVSCPRCGSTDVGYVQATKNRFGILTTVVSLLLAVYPFYANKTQHCFNCSHEFDK